MNDQLRREVHRDEVELALQRSYEERFREWCREQQADPEDLTSVFMFEGAFNEREET